MAKNNRTARRLVWLLVAPVLMGAAQMPPAKLADNEEIVVKGERLTPAEARERAVAYVQHTGIAAGKEAVARWIDKVCPRVVGLSAEHARIVATKVRAVAATVGAPLAPPACTPNISINFVGDGAAFASDVARRDRRRIAEVPFAERSELLTGTAPIRWWYLTEHRSADGVRMVGMDPAFVTGDGQAAGQVLPSNGESSTMNQFGSSNLSTQMSRALTSATVVVDTNRADGRTLDAIAAYAAFVALAELKPRATPLEGSILGLFGDAQPTKLTRLDETFLRELYDLPLDRKARQQRARIVRALQREKSDF